MKIRVKPASCYRMEPGNDLRCKSCHRPTGLVYSVMRSVGDGRWFGMVDGALNQHV